MQQYLISTEKNFYKGKGVTRNHVRNKLIMSKIHIHVS